MAKYTPLFFLILLIFSCKKTTISEDGDTKFSFDSFPLKNELTGKKYTYDSILNARKVLIKGNYLVVSNLGGNGNQLHILNKNTLGYVIGLGKIGDGPGEIRSGIWELDRGLDKNTFWAYDLNGKSFYEFSLKDFDRLAKRTIQQNEEWFLGYSMHWKNENEIITYLSRDTYKFGIFDTLGNRKSSIQNWKLGKEIDEQTGYVLMSLYQGPIEFNSTNHILAHASSQFESFQIINLNSKESITLVGPQQHEVDYKVESLGNDIKAFVSENTIKGYSDVFIGKNSIFLVYIGKTSAQRKKSGINSDTIFEFDLKGRPKALYKTDFPIRSIAVSEEERKIYAITTDSDPGITIFNY